MLQGGMGGWRENIRGVLQRSVLGLISFNASLINLAQKGKSVQMKFADCTKLGGTINTNENRNIVQEELDDLGDRSNRNGMKLNSTKCKVMH